MRGRAFLVCELPVAVSFAVCGITSLLSNIKTSLIVGLLFLAPTPSYILLVRNRYKVQCHYFLKDKLTGSIRHLRDTSASHGLEDGLSLTLTTAEEASMIQVVLN